MSDDKQQRVGMRKRLLNTITDSMDEFHKLPWEGADVQSAARPFNPASGTIYRGGNVTNLLVEQIERGSDDPRWMTLKQANAAGYGIRPGARGAVVEYWDFGQNKPEPSKEGAHDDNAEEPKKVTPKPFYAVVFNGQDIVGLPAFEKTLSSTPAERADYLILALQDKAGANFRVTEGYLGKENQNLARFEPFYDAQLDRIELPIDTKGESKTPLTSYESQSADALVTQLYLLAQWTGHESRLNRIERSSKQVALDVNSDSYTQELLRADIATMLLKNALGLEGEVYKPTDRSEQIANFLKNSKNGKDEIFRAARDAEKIVDYIFSFAPELKAEIDAQNKANVITERKKTVQVSATLAGLPNFIPVDAAPKEGRNDPRWQAYSDTVGGNLASAGYSTEVIEKSIAAIEPQFTTLMNAGKAKGKSDSELYAVFTQKIVDQLKPAKLYTHIWDNFCTEAKTINAEKQLIDSTVLSETLTNMGVRFHDLVKSEPTATDANRVALREKINVMLYGQAASGQALTEERLVALCKDGDKTQEASVTPDAPRPYDNVKTRFTEVINPEIPEGWVLMNAARPLVGNLQYEGDFLSGRYYAALDPSDEYFENRIKQNVNLDASVVLQATKDEISLMAMNVSKHKNEYLQIAARRNEPVYAVRLGEVDNLPYAQASQLLVDAKRELDGKSLHEYAKSVLEAQAEKEANASTEKASLYDLMPQFASKTVNRKQFRDVIIFRFGDADDDVKEKIFSSLGLEKGVSIAAFGEALDAYWSSKKEDRQLRNEAHNIIRRDSEHEQLVKFALDEYNRVHPNEEPDAEDVSPIDHKQVDSFADDMGIMDDDIITGYRADLPMEDDDIDFDFSDMEP